MNWDSSWMWQTQNNKRSQMTYQTWRLTILSTYYICEFRKGLVIPLPLKRSQKLFSLVQKASRYYSWWWCTRSQTEKPGGQVTDQPTSKTYSSLARPWLWESQQIKTPVTYQKWEVHQPSHKERLGVCHTETTHVEAPSFGVSHSCSPIQ